MPPQRPRRRLLPAARRACQSPRGGERRVDGQLTAVSADLVPDTRSGDDDRRAARDVERTAPAAEEALDASQPPHHRARGDLAELEERCAQLVGRPPGRSSRVPRDGSHRAVEVPRRSRRTTPSVSRPSPTFRACCRMRRSARDSSWPTSRRLPRHRRQNADRRADAGGDAACSAGRRARRGGPVAVLDHEEDRRGAPRRPLDQIPRVVAVKVSSELVDVINASSTGLLVEGAFPVRPGMTSYVDLIEVGRQHGSRQRFNRPLPDRLDWTEQAAVSIRHRVRSRGADDRRVARPVGGARRPVRVPLRGRGRPRGRQPGAEQLVATSAFVRFQRHDVEAIEQSLQKASRFDQRPDRLRRDRHDLDAATARIQPVVQLDLLLQASSARRRRPRRVPVLARGRSSVPGSRTTCTGGAHHESIESTTTSAARLRQMHQQRRSMALGEERHHQVRVGTATKSRVACMVITGTLQSALRGSSVGTERYVTPTRTRARRKASVTSRPRASLHVRSAG